MDQDNEHPNPNPAVEDVDHWEDVYHAELNEVFLLLDFIAGRDDKRLSSLQVDIAEARRKEDDPNEIVFVAKKLGAAEIAARISMLRFPQAGTEKKKSEDAAFLLLVKDALSALAYPATAQSIALTSIVSEELSQAGTWFAFLRRRLGGVGLAVPAGRARTDAGRTRTDIARHTFPNLAGVAIKMKSSRVWIVRMAMWMAVIASILLAGATYGGQLTARMQAAKRDEVAMAAAIYAAYNANKTSPSSEPAKLVRIENICPLPVPATLSAVPATVSALSGTASSDVTLPTQNVKLQGNTDTRFVVLCDAYAYSLASFRNAIADVDSYARFLPVRALSYLVLPIHELENRADDCKPSKDKDFCGARQETGPSVVGMVSAFANYLLPLLFGMVGAMAGIGRIIQDKIRDSLLAARDVLLLQFRLLFGGIAGASVGLFFDPAKVAADITSGNAGLSLSASGIAFLAGYGAPAFFGMLDKLIDRVFDFRTDRRPVSGVQPPHSS